VRGFHILSMGPKSEVTNSFGQRVGIDPIGGSQQLIFNNEVIFPIVESLGLKGIAFFDAGNAFSAAHGIDFGDLRMSVGPASAGCPRLAPAHRARVRDQSARGRRFATFMFSFGGPP